MKQGLMNPEVFVRALRVLEAEEFRNYLREAGLVVIRTPTTAEDLEDDLWQWRPLRKY